MLPGLYAPEQTRVVASRWTESQKTGAAGFAVKVLVRDSTGEEAGCWGTIWLTPKTLHGGFARGQLRALGIDMKADPIETWGDKAQNAHPPVIIEEYNNVLRVSRFGTQGPSREKLAELQEKIRKIPDIVPEGADPELGDETFDADVPW